MLFVARSTALPTPGDGDRCAETKEVQTSVRSREKQRARCRIVIFSKLVACGDRDGSLHELMSRSTESHVARSRQRWRFAARLENAQRCAAGQMALEIAYRDRFSNDAADSGRLEIDCIFLG